MNERDPELDALWRKHSAETPPPALDDAIRAAARRAVDAKPSPASPRARAPWPTWASFAAAASIGVIAIGAWQLLPRDVDETQTVTSDVPARAAAPAMAPRTSDETSSAASMGAFTAPKTPGQPTVAAESKVIAEHRATTTPKAAATPGEPQPMVRGAESDKARDAVDDSQPTAAKPAPFPGATADSRQRMEAVAPLAAPLAKERNDGGAQSAATATVPSAQQESARNTREHIDSIRRALAEHREVDAAAMLAEMRAQYADADARLPADLRQWAAGIARVVK